MKQSSQRVIDIVTPFYRVRDDCAELRFALRSIARNLPFIRKVWIFGDRPDWLSADKSVIEHVPHGYLAPLLGFAEPVRSEFRMLLLASLIPGLAFDFLWNADDQIVLEPLSDGEFPSPALHFSTVHYIQFPGGAGLHFETIKRLREGFVSAENYSWASGL